MPATFVVGRGRSVRAAVGTGDGDAVGEGVGEAVGGGVSGVIVVVGDGLGTATGACSRPIRARAAPMERTRAIATPLATLVRFCT
jgi:hypothetical protein